MIRLHLTEDDARLLGEVCGRVIAEGESSISADNLTEAAKAVLRDHTQRLRVIQQRLLTRLQTPATAAVKPGPKPRQARVRKPKIEAEVDAGFMP